jgi:uncharacterized protein YecE (DUF72 family)
VIDINKTPPDRAFLEEHIDRDRYLEFVSTRSPVFKSRPLPGSKEEAIDQAPDPRPRIEGDVRVRQEGLDEVSGTGRASVVRHIKVGTSGWSYPSGAGTWNGIFYPGKKPKGFDELAFYARHFDTVEVNSSFYRVPSPSTTASWARRAPDGFEFSLKLYQKFTHPEMFLKATGRDAADLDRKDVDEFRRAIDPLADAGKLGALLAQFPASFKNEPASRAYLEWLLNALRQYPVAVELRHRSFSEDPGEAMALLAGYGAALVQIDEPKFRDSIRQNRHPNVKTLYYMRLHGRNAAEWWSHQKSEDRYNYLYSAAELEPIVEDVEEASRQTKKTYVYANNHFSAKSVANAATIKNKLGQPLDGAYPEAFVDRYPDLKGLVKILPPAGRDSHGKTRKETKKTTAGHQRLPIGSDD